MRYTPSGKPVTSFSIVTEYTWQSSDGQQHEDSDWFNVVAWGELAEKCKGSLESGQRIYLEGRVKTREWVDDAGQDRAWAEIVAQDVIALATR
jgi:single-strand DNA-binding protein